MNRCTKGAVRLVFDHLEKRLGTYGFLSVFGCLLIDRGSEFGDPDTLETGDEGIQLPGKEQQLQDRSGCNVYAYER